MTELLKENEDYELIPIEDNPDAWGVRIKTGLFTETVVVFGAIGFNKVKDNLTFNFDVYSSPDSELTPEDTKLQKHCTKLLESIIISGIEDGTVDLVEPNASES
jgi:hypothetical protein